MSGFVDLLSGALATVFLVFIVMIVSFLQAQMQPTEGVYKLATESGLVFPIESYFLTDEIFKSMTDTFRRVYGEQPIYIGASCVVGGALDLPTAKRYSTYNIVFSKAKAKLENNPYKIASVEYLPVVKRKSQLANLCFITMKTEQLHDKYMEDSGLSEKELQITPRKITLNE